MADKYLQIDFQITGSTYFQTATTRADRERKTVKYPLPWFRVGLALSLLFAFPYTLFHIRFQMVMQLISFSRTSHLRNVATSFFFPKFCFHLYKITVAVMTLHTQNMPALLQSFNQFDLKKCLLRQEEKLKF